MHLMRTRLYVPGRTLWGAVTVRLVQKTGKGDYKKAGQFLKEQMRFGYLYLSDGEELFIPKYTEEGLKFGGVSLYEFEKKCVHSISTTSIDAYSLSAEEETLHHLEHINPYSMDDSSPLSLKGLLWVKKLESFSEQDDDLSLKYEGARLKLSELIQFLQVGGERKYGFGRIELSKLKRVDDTKLETEGFYGEWSETKESVNVIIIAGKPVWAHVECVPPLKIEGEIEIFTGREWDNRKGAGRAISSPGLCWVPGSVVKENTRFEVMNSGTWRIII